MVVKVPNKVQKSFSLRSSACENIEALCRVTGMSESAIIDGAVQAVWLAVVSGGFRQLPSIIEALSLTGAAGSSFYTRGRKVDEHER